MSEQPTTETAALDPTALRDAIGRKAALTALLDAVKGELATANTDVQWHIEQHAKATGSTKFDATLPNGVKVGSVSLAGGEAAAQVVDVDAFTAWVRSEYATEVTPRIAFDIAPAFLTKVLGEATAAGVAQYADPETGLVHDVPGVEIRPSRARTNRLTFSRASKSQPLNGRELVAKAYREGALADVLPALAPGGEPE
jgi:uncharacterized protein involved in outer membrane biogenesis